MGQPDQEVLTPDAAGARPVGFLEGVRDRAPGIACELLEHHRSRSVVAALRRTWLAYFLCTACLLTPRKNAISCHDQPCSRALRTCRASRRSASSRSSRAARRPWAGSGPLAAWAIDIS